MGPRIAPGPNTGDNMGTPNPASDKFDLEYTYVPGVGSYTVSGRHRMYYAASWDEMSLPKPPWPPYKWQWNKAINNTATTEAAWLPFYDGAWTVPEFSGAANLRMAFQNRGVPQSGYWTISWDDIVVEGTPIPPSEVWVNDDWVGTVPWTEVEPGKFFGYNAFATIQDGIDAVAGSTVNVAAGTYDETVKLDGTTPSGIFIIGENKDTTFITGGICFDAAYEGLEVQNFTISGNGFLDTETYEATVSCHWSGHYPITNLEFLNCIFDGEGYDDGEGGRCGVVIKRLGGDIKFENCEFKNYRGWAILDVNDGSGGGALSVTSYTLNNNNIHDNWGSCALRGNPTDRTDTVNITGNIFDNNGNTAANSWAALEINEADSVTVSNNTIINTQVGSWGDGQALQFWNIVTLDMHGNKITDNAQGIYIFSDGVGGTWCGTYCCPVPGGSISFNNISGNTDYGLKVDAAAAGGPLDAENNWWGHASGPSGPDGRVNKNGKAIGKGDAILGNVEWDPWLPQPVGHTKHDPVPPGLL